MLATRVIEGLLKVRRIVRGMEANAQESAAVRPSARRAVMQHAWAEVLYRGYMGLGLYRDIQGLYRGYM